MDSKEMNKVIVEEMKGPVCCPMIHEVASILSDSLESAAEFDFENDEDDIIIDIIRRLYIIGAYCEAVDMLYMVFSMVEDEESKALIMLVLSCGPSVNVSRMLIECFICHSDRIALDEVRSMIQEKHNKE